MTIATKLSEGRPSLGQMQFLLTLVETDIKRDGEYGSFMVRSGLLRDIIKSAIERAEQLARDGAE